jgi:hypothetical protein
MGIMVERSCAVVQVDGIAFLCLLRGEAFVSVEAPFHQDDLSGSPLDGARVIEVMPGTEQMDFCWVSIGPDQIIASTSLPQAGVAAAITARLYGLAPGTGKFLGQDVAGTKTQIFFPPTGEWWCGTWAAGSSAASAVCFDATIVMHGEMVVRDGAAAEPCPLAGQERTP